MKDVDLYLDFLKEIKKLETNTQKDINIFTVYGHFLVGENTQESYYLLMKMIKDNLLDKKIIKNIKNSLFTSKGYFIQHMPNETFKDLRDYKFAEYIQKNYEELLKNEWELLIQEGVNPNEIVKMIQNDDVEKLQEISSQTNFDFNQTIKPTLYERYSFVNKKNVTLIDYAAFFGSEKCFKYLIINGSKVENTGKYAIAGGNEEIIHLCEQNHLTFEGAYEAAIEFHRNDIFKYIYENKLEKIQSISKISKDKTNDLVSFCIKKDNYEILEFFEEKGINITVDNINESARKGNLYLVKYFLQNNQIPKNILPFASESGNIEIVKYILDKEGIDVNATNIHLNNLIYVLIF